MNEFDEYINDKYPSDYLLMTVRYPDQELCELYPDQFEVWMYQQDRIDELQSRNDYLSKKFNDLARLILDECEDILKGNKYEN